MSHWGTISLEWNCHVGYALSPGLVSKKVFVYLNARSSGEAGVGEKCFRTVVGKSIEKYVKALGMIIG